MDTLDLTSAKRRILDALKHLGPVTASKLAHQLEITDVAIRQHLQRLEEQQLVDSAPLAPDGRGRPAAIWQLTAAGHALFPEKHADLTVDLIEATRKVFGEAGLDRILRVRSKRQVEEYKKRLPPLSASLKKRVDALAQLRMEEGYMAEVIVEKPGRYLLVEHHCPICDAAESCLGLCTTELSVFRKVLGADVTVERIAHLLAGEERCVYRIRQREPQ